MREDDPPLFSQAAIDGKCPACNGSQFRRPFVSRWSGPLLTRFLEARSLLDCVTCGKRFRRG